jgi:hypothetical protein
MINECGAVGGMMMAKRDRGTRRNPTPVPLYPTQVPYELTWD